MFTSVAKAEGEAGICLPIYTAPASSEVLGTATLSAADGGMDGSVTVAPSDEETVEPGEAPEASGFRPTKLYTPFIKQYERGCLTVRQYKLVLVQQRNTQ